jgi:tRNA A-37 threonylcarbamoyl transferase component Bud32
MPNGFIQIKQGGTVALVRKEGYEQIADALIHGKGCVPMDAAGRGTMLKFPLTEEHAGIVRKYKRGGMVRLVLRDSFFFRNRPLSEFLTHCVLVERNLPVPLLLGVCWKQQGCFISGALATKEIAGSDLDTWLRYCNHTIEEKTAMLHLCGQTIRLFHDTNVYHRDLQLKNIFVHNNTPVLLDFDGATIDRPVRRFWRGYSLLRLKRSFDKLGHERELFERLIHGYGEFCTPKWLDVFYTIKGFLSDMIFSRRIPKLW